MKKKILFTLILLVFAFSLFLVPKKDNTLSKPNNNDNNALAIMVYDEESNDYIKNDQIPKGSYVLNDEKSFCTSGDISFDYDNTKGTIKYQFNTADNCYLYFDAMPSLSSYIVSLYSTDSVNDLYLHDGIGTYENASLEANDMSYRYSGVSPNNFVCLGASCEDSNNLYRIIGVFNERVKLIKYEYALSDTLGTNGDYNAEVYLRSDYPNYTGSAETLNRYYWNYNNGSETNSNDWLTSNLNKVNLNTNFASSLSDFINYVDDSTWIISGMPWSEMSSLNNNAKRAYDYEIADTCSYCTSKASKKVTTSKFALMYASDYMYAPDPKYWTKSAYYTADRTQDYSSVNKESWIYGGLNEWLLSPNTDSIRNSYSLDSTGFVSNNRSNSRYYSIRLCLYLKKDVKITGGTGTKENPYTLYYNG